MLSVIKAEPTSFFPESSKGKRLQSSYQHLANWEALFLPLLTGELQAERKSVATSRWKVGEVMIKVCKGWHYLYRSPFTF